MQITSTLIINWATAQKIPMEFLGCPMPNEIPSPNPQLITGRALYLFYFTLE